MASRSRSERGAKVSGARGSTSSTGLGAAAAARVAAACGPAGRGRRVHVDDPTGADSPEIMEGTGFLGEHAAEVYRLRDDDLYLVGTSEVPLAGTTPTRSSTSPPGRAVTPAGRRASAASSGPTARTPAASSGCTSSTRSRCPSTPARTTPRPSTSASSAGRSGCSPPSSCRTGSSTSPPAIWGPAWRASSSARRGLPARAPTASSRPRRTAPRSSPGG